jgi:hypothetical protein
VIRILCIQSLSTGNSSFPCSGEEQRALLIAPTLRYYRTQEEATGASPEGVILVVTSKFLLLRITLSRVAWILGYSSEPKARYMPSRQRDSCHLGFMRPTTGLHKGGRLPADQKVA